MIVDLPIAILRAVTALGLYASVGYVSKSFGSF